MLNKLPAELLAHKEKIANTLVEYIKLVPKETSDLKLWSSKIGGKPYLPKGIAFPAGVNGNPLVFLAQFNFEEMPELASFPTKGILQFYVGDDDLYGLNFEDRTTQGNFKVIYIEEVSKNVHHLETDFSHLTKYKYAPLNKAITIGLDFELTKEYLSTQDYNFEKQFGMDFFRDFGDKEWDLMDAYEDMISNQGHKLGGYATFVQEDPRPFEEDLILLFQLDSDDALGIMWGDMGVANFFIKKEDLENKDFSKVMYNWDCA